jgi:hypothetical protein
VGGQFGQLEVAEARPQVALDDRANVAHRRGRPSGRLRQASGRAGQPIDPVPMTGDSVPEVMDKRWPLSWTGSHRQTHCARHRRWSTNRSSDEGGRAGPRPHASLRGGDDVATGRRASREPRAACRVPLSTAQDPHPFFQQTKPDGGALREIERCIATARLEWTIIRPGMFASNALNHDAPKPAGRSGDERLRHSRPCHEGLDVVRGGPPNQACHLPPRSPSALGRTSDPDLMPEGRGEGSMHGLVSAIRGAASYSSSVTCAPGFARFRGTRTDGSPASYARRHDHSADG